MSHFAPWGREIPRWSVLGQPALSPASMAGLPARRAWVGVGPPLSWSGPSFGSVLLRSPVWLKKAAHEASPLRLWPWETRKPLQLPPVLAVITVFFSFVPPPL